MEKPNFLKFTHAEVSYEHPSKHRPEQCRVCKHFIADGHERNNDKFSPRCEGVRSPIRAEDWCKRFEKERGTPVLKRLAAKEK
jgi:Fe-S-cluster containining protein